MSLQSRAEREIEALERDMENASPEELKELRRMVRDVERERADEERWRNEGEERGWQ